MKVSIHYAIGNSCGLCREVCPESAIRPKLCERRHLYEVQAAKCSGSVHICQISATGASKLCSITTASAVPAASAASAVSWGALSSVIVSIRP